MPDNPKTDNPKPGNSMPSRPKPGKPFICPHDGLPLQAETNRLVCAGNHSFDIAREGYVNLLASNHKPSRDPGDSKTMVAARRQVLDAGVFSKLASELASQVVSLLATKKPVSAEESATATEPLIVDAGCGEGYYTNFMQDKFDADDVSAECVGIDISKWAVRAAAKRYSSCRWAVANNKSLPFDPGAVELITSLFGFETWLPWSILQSSGQSVLVVSAGARHLIELRELIYEKVEIHNAPAAGEALTAGYTCESERQLCYTHLLESGAMCEKLLQMTPHAHRASRQALERVSEIESLNVTIDVTIRLFEKA